MIESMAAATNLLLRVFVLAACRAVILVACPVQRKRAPPSLVAVDRELQFALGQVRLGRWRRWLASSLGCGLANGSSSPSQSAFNYGRHPTGRVNRQSSVSGGHATSRTESPRDGKRETARCPRSRVSARAAGSILVEGGRGSVQAQGHLPTDARPSPRTRSVQPWHRQQATRMRSRPPQSPRRPRTWWTT